MLKHNINLIYVLKNVPCLLNLWLLRWWLTEKALHITYYLLTCAAPSSETVRALTVGSVGAFFIHPNHSLERRNSVRTRCGSARDDMMT